MFVSDCVCEVFVIVYECGMCMFAIVCVNVGVFVCDCVCGCIYVSVCGDVCVYVFVCGCRVCVWIV